MFQQITNILTLLGIGGILGGIYVLYKLMSKWRDVGELMAYKEKHDTVHTDLNKTLKEDLQSIRKDQKEDMKSFRKVVKEDMKSFRKDIKEDMKPFRKDQEEIKSQLKTQADSHDKLIRAIEDWTGLKLIETKSPLNLNERGREVAAEINAEGLIESHFEKIKKAVNVEGHDNLYDLHEACFALTDKNNDSGFSKILTNEELKVIKEVAYRHSLDIAKIFEVIACLFRNKMIEEYPELFSHTDDVLPSQESK